MTRQRYCIANWKMNLSASEATRFYGRLSSSFKKEKPDCRVVVCPPAPYLSLGSSETSSHFFLGAQHVHYRSVGAFTGECSAEMISEFARYVLVGHSERRRLFGMTDKDVGLTVKSTLDAGLSAIVCIGETHEEHDGDLVLEVLRRQLKAALDHVPVHRMDRIVLAYEPVWAISSMNPVSPPSSEDIATIMLWLRREIGTLYSFDVADRCSLLYGGSVTADNLSQYVGEGLMDGALVGGASLDDHSFLRIISQYSSLWDK